MIIEMERYLKSLEGMWVSYFNCLPIEPYEHDIYVNIINKINKNDFDFTEADKNNILRLIHIIIFECDEYEIKILQILEKELRDTSIVFGREDITEVHKSQLISDYNECIDYPGNPYGFLRVLSAKEKRRFVDRMSPDTLVYCYKTRSIKTREWLQILNSISLETKYYVYRKSYWGENAGNTKVSSIKTPTMVLIDVVSGVHEDTCKKNRVNLLIENNRVSIIDKIISSTWSNNAYLLDHTEDTIC